MRSIWKPVAAVGGRIIGATGLSLLLAVSSPLASAANIDLQTLNLVGTSQLVSGNVLRLTPNFDTNPTGDPPAGAAWTTTRFDVADPFTIHFDFQMSDPTGKLDNDGSGGDGIAFVIQNSSVDGSAAHIAGASGLGDNALGRGAGGMGFFGIYNSLAVMLDTYQNNYAYGDPSGNYIAVNTRGADFNVPHHFCTDGQLTTDPSKPPDLPGVPCTSNPGLGLTGQLTPLLDDGNIQDLTLYYQPGDLQVVLNSRLVLTVPVDLANTLSLDGGKDAFLGFTAGTRFAYQNQDILDFSVQTVPEPATSEQWLMAIGVVAVMGLKRKWQKGRS